MIRYSFGELTNVSFFDIFKDIPLPWPLRIG